MTIRMPCSVTAALRQYEAEQARAELQAPTDQELEDYVIQWMDTKATEIGREFVMEPICESELKQQDAMLSAFIDNDPLKMGQIVIGLVEAYWRKSAEEAASEHDFSEDRCPDV